MRAAGSERGSRVSAQVGALRCSPDATGAWQLSTGVQQEANQAHDRTRLYSQRYDEYCKGTQRGYVGRRCERKSAAQSRHRCGTGERSPGADVARVSAQSRRRCGAGWQVA